MATSDELKAELQQLTEEIIKLREQMEGGGDSGDGGGTGAAGDPTNLDQLKQEEEVVSKMVGAYEKRNRAAKGDNLFNKQKTELLKNQGQQLEKQNEELFKKKGLNEDDVKSQKEQVNLFKKKKKEQDDIQKNLEKAVGTQEDFGNEVARSFQIFKHELAPTVATFGKVLDRLKTPLSSLHQAMAGIGTAMINNTIGLAFQLYDMENAFMQATGANEQFARSLTNTFEATKQLGVSAKEVRGAYEDLFGTFTDFTMLTAESREYVGDNAVMLGRLGVSSKDFASAMQLTTKAMAQNAEQSADTARSMVAMAKDIGVAPNQMIADFGKVGGELAKLGRDGPRAFKDLAIAAKVTGMEVDKLLKITDQFDTFDKAAEMSGRLNAMLGGNFVNAMDMMMETDPAARFDMIRDALSDAGLEFDNMSYYQRKMYAESLGLSSVAELAQVMSGNTEELSGNLNKTRDDYEAMAKNAQAVQSLQEQFNGLIAAATPVLTPLIDGLRSFVGLLQENQKVITPILQSLMAYKGLMMAFNVVQAISNLKFLAFAAALGAVAYILYEKQYASNFIDGMWKFVGAATALMAAMTIMGVIVKKNSVSFGGFAIAALALGAAFYVASMAIDNIADSLIKLGPQAKDLNTTLAIMGATVLGLFVTLTVLAVKTGGVAVVAVLAFGAALLAMGYGAQMAADAFGTLVNHWAKAQPSMLFTLAAGAIALAGAVVALATSGKAGAIGIGLLTAGVLGLASAFYMVGAAIEMSANAMTEMFKSTGTIDTTALENFTKEFEKIQAAMDKVPLVKVIAWTAVMDKVQIEAPAVRATAPAAAAAAATATTPAAMASGGAPAAAAPAQQANERPYNVTINVQMDGSTVGSSTVQLLAGKAKNALLGIGGG